MIPYDERMYLWSQARLIEEIIKLRKERLELHALVTRLDKDLAAGYWMRKS